MPKMLALLSGALVAVACAGPAQAHHSYLLYDPTMPLWIKGTVVRFDNVDPHSLTRLEERTADGQIRPWIVEGPARAGRIRSDPALHIPQVGEVLEFCAFPYKSPAELAKLGAQFATRSTPDAQRVWGHVMVTPDAEKWAWNPHGIIFECIRSSDDPRESWAEFLNANGQARASFCRQTRNAQVQSNASLKELVEEVDRALDDPCD